MRRDCTPDVELWRVLSRSLLHAVRSLAAPVYCVVAVNGTVEAELGFVGPPDVSDKFFVCGIFRKEPVSKAYSNWWILRLQSVVNCPAIRVQFKFSPQNALQNRHSMPRLAERLLVDCLGWSATDPTIASVLKGHSRRWSTRCILLSVGDNSMFFKFLLKVVDCFPSFLVGGVITGNFAMNSWIRAAKGVSLDSETMNIRCWRVSSRGMMR